MRSFSAGAFGVGALIFIVLSVAQSTFAWVLLAILCIVVAGSLLPKRAVIDPEPSAGGQVAVASPHSYELAVQAAKGGGFTGIMASNWLKAFAQDASVPPFGERPYWTPTGPGGTPQFLTTMGMQGVERRLDYVRHDAAEESLLAIMADDPDPRVRDAARARLR